MLSLYTWTFLVPAEGFELTFEPVLQEYLQIPYEYFLLVNFVIQTTPEEKITRIKIR
jgi:hypothetical protein